MRAWKEIASRMDKPRFDALKASLQQSKSPEVADWGEFIECDDPADKQALLQGFSAALASAQHSSESIRIGSVFASVAGELAVEFSAEILTLKTVESFEKMNSRWWPKHWTAEGLIRSIAHDMRSLNLQGKVLLIGAHPHLAATVSAVSRLGFMDFSLIDPVEANCEKYLQQLRRGFFKTRFHKIQAENLTLLPADYSVVVNFMGAEAEIKLEGLAYLNFLKNNATWIEMEIGRTDSPLLQEVSSMGTQVEHGSRVAARADAAWAEFSYQVELSVEAHAERLQNQASVP